MNSNIFDLTRFKHLLKREIMLNYKPLLIVTGSILGILGVGLTFNQWMVSPHTNSYSTETLNSVLGFSTIIWASISFHELVTTPGRQFYLGLPASTFEKLMSKWLTISILLPISFISIFIIFSQLITFLVNSFGRYHIPSPSYDFDTIAKTTLIYILCQSAFYLGSIIWPKLSLFKTILALICIAIGIGLISSLIGRIVFHEYFQDGSYVISDNGFSINSELFDNIPYLGKLLSYALYIFFMVASYFKLKEKEL